MGEGVIVTDGPALTESECAPRKRISDELVWAVVAITLLLHSQSQLGLATPATRSDIPVDGVEHCHNVQVAGQGGVAVRRSQGKTILS
jgi:hypothetical protein